MVYHVIDSVYLLFFTPSANRNFLCILCTPENPQPSPKLFSPSKLTRKTAQNIIEVGKRLIAAKSLVAHGQWQAWLEQNFSLTERTARRFMQISERFNKTVDVDQFKPSQLTELLALPDAEETEKFIAEKAAEGKAVADMTIKQLREDFAATRIKKTAQAKFK